MEAPTRRSVALYVIATAATLLGAYFLRDDLPAEVRAAGIASCAALLLVAYTCGTMVDGGIPARGCRMGMAVGLALAIAYWTFGSRVGFSRSDAVFQMVLCGSAWSAMGGRAWPASWLEARNGLMLWTGAATVVVPAVVAIAVLAGADASSVGRIYGDLIGAMSWKLPAMAVIGVSTFMAGSQLGYRCRTRLAGAGAELAPRDGL
jgi:hypothetical protein